MHGLVVKNTGSWYTVHTDNGRSVNCKIKGVFRLKEIRSTNPIAIGDRVEIQEDTDGVGLITAIDERKNYMIRRSSNLSKQSHILAANIDLTLLIITINYPQTTTIFIDRYLATAEAYRIPAILLFNKIDRYDSTELEYMEELLSLYRSVGYDCMKLCALSGQGISDLSDIIRNKITLLAGHSGVGKSTIINQLLPEANLRTKAISEYHKSGVHTTTFSEMVSLPNGGYLIDTPGIKGFGTIEMQGGEVAHYFREIFKTSADCRFNNCTHTIEPGCAVRKAVEEDRISRSRYKSYLNILEDKDGMKYREAY